MTAALLAITVASAIFWLVFFKLKLLRLTPGWGLIFGFFVIHLLLVFVIGLRFVTPDSANATVVQRTIQLVPRLPEPTLVTAVLVEENVPVKKNQPLFQFDRRPYEYKVAQISAQLAEAKQNVDVLKADVDIATQKTAGPRSSWTTSSTRRAYSTSSPVRARCARRTWRNGQPASAPRKRPATRRWPNSNAPVSSTNPRSTA